MKVIKFNANNSPAELLDQGKLGAYVFWRQKAGIGYSVGHGTRNKGRKAAHHKSMHTECSRIRAFYYQDPEAIGEYLRRADEPSRMQGRPVTHVVVWEKARTRIRHGHTVNRRRS